MRTLFIDDDPIGVFLTQQLLKREGITDFVTAFQCPVKALAYLREQVLLDAAPHVILLDLNMPLLSGWDLLAALQPLEDQLWGRCAIYLLTSSLAPHDLLRAEANPLVQRLIHKPLTSNDIQEIYAPVLRKTMS